MKKFCIIITAFLLLGQSLSAQLQIRTHKEKISDFMEKVTMVVLTGNDSLDVPIREAVKNFWTISAYELCSTEEFEALKANEDYYFLAVGSDNNGLRSWYLVKGGGKKPLESMLNVATVAICPADGFTGREESLLPALACLLQNLVGKAIGRPYTGSGLTISSPKKALGIPLYLCPEEFSAALSDTEAGPLKEKEIYLVDRASADCTFMEADKAAVCFVVAPISPKKKQVSYVYLVDASTFELYYFKKHKISDATDCGLLPEDLKAFMKGR